MISLFHFYPNDIQYLFQVFQQEEIGKEDPNGPNLYILFRNSWVTL